MERIRRSGLVLVFLLSLSAGCSLTGDRSSTAEPERPDQSAQPTPTTLRPDEAPSEPGDPGAQNLSVAELVARITEPGSLSDAGAAVREALARGGIATGDFETILVAPYPPASSLALLPQELLTILLEAQAGPTAWSLDLDELAQLLGDFGWEFEADLSPGEKMALFFHAWAAEAQQHPQDPHSFAPLFIRSMAEWRQPGLDLAAEPPASEEVRLGLLELILFVAAFDRVLLEETTAASLPPLGMALSAPLGSTWLQTTPCSDYQKLLFGRFSESEVVKFSSGFAAGHALEKALEALGISEWGVDRVGRAMFGVGMLSRVLRAVLITGYVGIRVEIEGDNPVHKVEEGEQLLKEFRAHVEISPQAWDDYQKEFGRTLKDAVSDCFGWLGVPSMPTLDDLVKEMESWAVEWRIDKDNPHAHWSEGQQIMPGARHLGFWRTGVIREGGSGSVGMSSFVVEVREEKASDHPGLLFKAPMEVCAHLDLARTPTLSTFANAAAGLAGAADSVVELLQNGMQKLAKPKKCEVLTVTFHQAYDLYIEYSGVGIAAAPGLPKALTVAWQGSGDVPLGTLDDGTQVSGIGGLGVLFEVSLTAPDLSCSATIAQEQTASVEGHLDAEREVLNLTTLLSPGGEFIPMKERCVIPGFWNYVAGFGGPLAGLGFDPQQWSPPFTPYELPLKDGATRTFTINNQGGEMVITVTLVKK